MFTSKKTTLIDKSAKTSAVKTATNPFVKAGLKKGAETLSGNGSLKYKTSGNSFLDQFNSLGSYKAPRTYAEIARDQDLLWSVDPKTTVLFTYYVRTITRTVQLFDGSKTIKPQKGGELKHEAIMRMIWLSKQDSTIFWNNIGLFVSVGSWKDIFTMLQYDLVYNGWEGRVLDWQAFGGLIMTSLQNANTLNLVKKYLPQIKATSACKTVESQADTIIGKWICSLLFGNKESPAQYKQYRKLKTSGNAHDWQKLISQGKHQLIDFNSIHGRALNLLVRSKYLKNQGLSEKYEAWVTKPDTEVKFTGFVHELFANLPSAIGGLNNGEQATINKQFTTLVNKGRTEDHTSSLIVVRDTSGSMGNNAVGTKMPANDIARAIALFFSEFLTGRFANSWIEFNDNATMHQWRGNTTLNKWYNDHTESYGSTNFQSVLQLFASIKGQGVAEGEFPTGILCISDGMFNATELGQTNVEAGLNILRHAGFSEDYVSNFVICLWNIPNGYYTGSAKSNTFETYGTEVPNVFYISGYSASVISFLTSKIKNAQELFDEAMNQEILQMIKV